MSFVFEPPACTAVPVNGSDKLFPVRRIYCVGRNYVEHAQEMGATGREAPFFFMKPADAISVVPDASTGRIDYPTSTNDLHHEVELVVAIGKQGANIAEDQAHEFVWGYAVGLDMTRRDLQQQAKDARRPWETGKSFDQSAPIGPIHPSNATGFLHRGAIWLDVNGARRQSGDLSQLIWTVEETIAHLSTLFELRPGDLIFTGTPKGVGPVQRGDLVVCGIDGLGCLTLRVG